MTDEQFMIQILNSLTEDDVNNPLTIEELKEELTLRFERMIDKTDSVKLCSSKSFTGGLQNAKKLVIVFNRYLSDYNLVLKRFSNTLYIRSPFLLYLLSLLLS
jgi:hypothetical protein